MSRVGEKSGESDGAKRAESEHGRAFWMPLLNLVFCLEFCISSCFVLVRFSVLISLQYMLLQ